MSSDTLYDVSTYPDLDPTFGNVTRRRGIAERMARRFSTPQGFLEYAPDDGLDLRSYLSRGLDVADLPRLQLEMKAEAEKDEEVLSAVITLTLDTATAKLRAQIVLVVDDEGPITLTLEITKLTVELLSVT